MCTHIRGVHYLLPSETDDIDRKNNAIQQWKTMGKISAPVLLFIITRQNNLSLYNYSQNVLTWISGSI